MIRLDFSRRNPAIRLVLGFTPEQKSQSDRMTLGWGDSGAARLPKVIPTGAFTTQMSEETEGNLVSQWGGFNTGHDLYQKLRTDLEAGLFRHFAFLSGWTDSTPLHSEEGLRFGSSPVS